MSGSVTGADTPWSGAPIARALTSRKVCPKKKAARSEAKGWRSSSPRWRQPAEAAQPEDPQVTADGEVEGEVEVEEVRHEPNSGEAREE